VPPWASEGALFKHVAQGAKMPSYGPELRHLEQQLLKKRKKVKVLNERHFGRKLN
jgi:hypothetical protein